MDGTDKFLLGFFLVSVAACILFFGGLAVYIVFHSMTSLTSPLFIPLWGLALALIVGLLIPYWPFSRGR